MTPLYDLNLPPYDLKVNSGSSDQHASSSSWSRKDDGDYGSASDHNNNGSSVKYWMSSEMMNTNCSSPPLADHNNKLRYPIRDTDENMSFGKTNSTIRVCSDCNTTTTPLWRGGPRGPKSLCNACGIRQRKARRALEAAAAAAEPNGVADAKEKDVMSMKIKVHNKKGIEKSRTSHVGSYKTQLKTKPGNNCRNQKQKRLCFKKFALSLSKNSALQRVFTQDVEDAAILLMELSCGFFHT